MAHADESYMFLLTGSSGTRMMPQARFYANNKQDYWQLTPGTDDKLSVVFRYNGKNSTVPLAMQNDLYPVQMVSSIAFVRMAESGLIDAITATENIAVFSPWVTSVQYKQGDMRRYDGKLYQCIVAHTSQEGWSPDVAASLWKLCGDPAEEWPEWSQPIGAHDAYNTGDQVTFGGKHWRSTIDGNVWQPGVAGWEEVFE